MEHDLNWERPGIEIDNGTIWHNEKTWYVKTNGHPNTDGTRWGWIEGTEPEVRWTNSGETFNELDADQVVKEHAEWLAAQVPHDLRVIRAMQDVERRARDVDRLEGLLALAAEALREAEDTATAANIARASQHDQAIVGALMRAAQSIVDHVDIPSGAARRVSDHIETIAEVYGGQQS